MNIKVFYDSKFAKAILPPSCLAITLFDFVFCTKSKSYCDEHSPNMINHKSIHANQCLVLGVIGLIVSITLSNIVGSSLTDLLLIILGISLFYVEYVIEYLVRLIIYLFKGKGEYDSIHNRAYRSLSAEREAYINESNNSYLNNAHIFEQFKYLFKL